MTIPRGMDGSEPIRPEPVQRVAGLHEERRAARSWRMASGTLACPGCDAPVVPALGRSSPAAPLACPFCGHAAAVRDFLSLETPSRPARVGVYVVHRARAARLSDGEYVDTGAGNQDARKDGHGHRDDVRAGDAGNAAEEE